uniref:Uncharacterized protein n=1 Tax=Pararge aegeria TaxID=116150 RepID=S4P7C8_9NEOP
MQILVYKSGNRHKTTLICCELAKNKKLLLSYVLSCLSLTMVKYITYAPFLFFFLHMNAHNYEIFDLI